MNNSFLQNEPHTSSVWEGTFFGHRDVIIIGAGLSGLWTAFNLKEKHNYLNILILERSFIPSGASTRNAGFACFGSPSEIISDQETIGNKVWPIIEMRYKGIQKIRKVLGDGPIDYDPCGGYECLDDGLNIDHITYKIGDINRNMKIITGSDNTFTVVDKFDNLGLTGFEKLIKNNFEGGLHSGKLINTLTQKVLSMGVRIMNGVELISYEETSRLVKIHTNRGNFTSLKMILCTNAFTNNITDNIIVKPARGQILLTNPIEGLKLNGTFHYDEGFIYFRNLGNRILLGGARNEDFKNEETTEIEVTDKIQTALEKFLAHHIIKGKSYKIERRWSGIMGFTKNKEPEIHVSESGNILTVASCNGMGVAMTPIFTEKVADEIFS